ncbi:MAG: Do family serine endopeptidase [Armatimonadota bacterium]|nr:Do family serine endopeptidase [bacterium]
MRTALSKQPSLVVVCLLSIALGFSLAANYYHHSPAQVIAAPAKDTTPSDWRTAFEDIAEKVGPSVVFITSEKTIEVTASPFGGFDNFFNFSPFGSPKIAPETKKQTQTASGSGVIVRSDGYILTNNHVVAGADVVKVKLLDGREFKGKVLLDPRTDLALVKIDAKDLPVAQFADSDKVKVGQWSMAVGAPFGLRNTVTVGVVSAVRREVDPNDPLPYAEVIQTDASINPGNSGGPLVDLDGKVIGINGAIYSTSGGNVGIGFAIPSNTAKFVMSQLIDKGKVVRGYLGVEMRDLTPTFSEKLGAKEGALVTSIQPDSAAEKAGIQVKDVIIRVDGKPVGSGAQLRHAVEAIAPGTEAKIVVIRDKAEKTLTITIGEAPAGTDESGSEGGTDKTGLSVQPLTPDIAKEIGVDKDIQGVVVRKVESGSAAERAGLRAKDVIMEIDNTPITSVATFSKAVEKLQSGDTAVIVAQRGERSVIIEMSID